MDKYSDEAGGGRGKVRDVAQLPFLQGESASLSHAYSTCNKFPCDDHSRSHYFISFLIIVFGLMLVMTLTSVTLLLT